MPPRRPRRNVKDKRPVKYQQQQNASSSSQSQSQFQSLEQRHNYFELRSPSSLPPSPSSPLITTRAKGPLPLLPDDIWSKILFHAGTTASMNCLRASVQLRRHALSSLSKTPKLQLSRHFRHDRTAPSPSQIFQTLRALSSLQTLAIHNWPFMDSIPDISDLSLQCVSTRTLERLELIGVPVNVNSMTRILNVCKCLKVVCLGGSDHINDDFLSKVFNSSDIKKSEGRLECLKIVDARCVGDIGVKAVASYGLESIELRKLKGLTFVSCCVSSMSSLIISMCEAVITVDIQCNPFNENDSFNGVDINLCQNRSLAIVLFHATLLKNEQNINLARSINVSHCPKLCGVGFVSESLELVNSPFLQDINLFGGRQLSSRTFYNFGLSVDANERASKLQQVTLNGSSAQCVILKNYNELRKVDVSGSNSLNVLRIQGCGKMERVVTHGARMHTSLHDVHICVPVACAIIGKRREWTSERGVTLQTVWYQS